MAFIGAGLMMFAALVLWREYVSYLNKGLSQISEFVKFIKNMRERMECYLEGPASWINDFSSSALEEIGFLPNIRAGLEIGAAYTECSNDLSVTKDADAIFSELFRHIGDGYLATELGAIDAAVRKLEAIEESIKSERESKIKAVGAMLGAVVLGIVILIL